MKIAIIRSYPLKDEESYNVQERGLATALSQTDEVLLILPGGKKTISRGRVTTVYLPTVKILGNHQFLIGLPRSLRSFDPDVVLLAFDTQLYGIYCAWLARKLRVSVIAYQGTFSCETPKQKFQYGLIDALARRHVQAVFAKTYRAAELMTKRAYDRVYILGVGLDESRFNMDGMEQKVVDLRNELRVLPHHRVLLHVGELSARRNAEETLQILRYIIEEDDRYVAVVVGDGPFKDHPEFRHERLIFVGRIPQSKIPAYYLLMHALINPCKNEIFGMTFLEAIYFNKLCFGFYTAPGAQYLRGKFPRNVQLVTSMVDADWMAHINQTLSLEESNVVGFQREVTWNHIVREYKEALKNILDMQRER